MDKVAQEGQKAYQRMVQAEAPKPNSLKNTTLAFLVGGGICLIGQFFFDIAQRIEPTKGEASAVTLAVMIVLGAIATGLGVYDWLAERAGMGAAIPITGFSNTITAAAMDFRREGWILGMGPKMFYIAGPILVYGILSAFIMALIRAALTGMFR